jgi:hypothetical protein
MTKRGLLLTLTEPPAGKEEEFNAWYDEEHLPERLSIPGFLSARRWVADCAPGEGKYLATYELESAAVLQSAAYLEKFKNQTPWSRRCLGKTVVFRRWACEQRLPGGADADPAAVALLVLLGDRPLELPETLRARSRHFHAPEAKEPHIALVELTEAGSIADATTALPGGRLYRAYR